MGMAFPLWGVGGGVNRLPKLELLFSIPIIISDEMHRQAALCRVGQLMKTCK